MAKRAPKAGQVYYEISRDNLLVVKEVDSWGVLCWHADPRFLRWLGPVFSWYLDIVYVGEL